MSTHKPRIKLAAEIPWPLPIGTVLTDYYDDLKRVWLVATIINPVPDDDVVYWNGQFVELEDRSNWEYCLEVYPNTPEDGDKLS